MLSLSLDPIDALSLESIGAISNCVARSSTVASDRSGNERAVNVAKRAGVLKRGLRPNESSDVIADVWIAWGFQANFMYKPVL